MYSLKSCDALGDRALAPVDAVDLQEAAELTHGLRALPLMPGSPAPRCRRRPAAAIAPSCAERGALGRLAQHALVVARHDLDPGAAQLVPVGEHALGDRRPGALARAPRPARGSPRSPSSRRVLEVDELLVAARRRTCPPRRARTRCRRDMPAAKLRPVGPSTTTRPPVMYSQPWSPTPSTTAWTPELRTPKRSPARPRKNALPLVAP